METRSPTHICVKSPARSTGFRAETGLRQLLRHISCVNTEADAISLLKNRFLQLKFQGKLNFVGCVISVDNAWAIGERAGFQFAQRDVPITNI